MSSIVNKIKEAVHSDKHHENTPEGTHGPHTSRVANAADPRVDSDLDGSRTMGASRTAGHGEFGTGQAYTSEGGVHRAGMSETGYANPRATEGAGFGTEGNAFGTERHFAGSGATGVTGMHQPVPEGTHGPHNNRAMNAMDPRVDSDRDGRAALGTGPGPAPNTAGPHRSDMVNKVDPRVDSDMDGSKTFGGNKTYQ